MWVFANNVSLLFVFRRFAHLNTLNDSNGLVKLLEQACSTPATQRCPQDLLLYRREELDLP
jgi:hypothetical protein